MIAGMKSRFEIEVGAGIVFVAGIAVAALVGLTLWAFFT